MPLTCPRCRRSHPEVAVYCHFDGTALRHGTAPAGQFLQEFVFASGRRCRTFDELVEACYAEWDDARQLLADGAFAAFMASLGRADLAKLARECQGMAERDVALTNFLAGLPAAAAITPRLELSPRRLVVGPVRVGETRPVQITVKNEGSGLLQGKLTVGDGADWLSLDDTHVKTGREQMFKLTVNTAKLTVGQNYIGKLVAVTNGGAAELPIRLDLVARPFARAPYQGANSPHELARKMRDNPKPAVELIETGEIARWFATNGWTYPIVGEPAPGLACVQQYFEELGLAKAPHITISLSELRLTVTPPQRPTVQLILSSSGRKLVYGRAETNVSWLKVARPSVSGQAQATIELEIDSTLMDEDKLYTGAVKVIANAGQTFVVPVQVDVKGNKRGWFSNRPAAPAPAPAPVAVTMVPAAPATMVPPVPATMAPPPLPKPAYQPPPRPFEPEPAAASGGERRFGFLQAVLAGAVLGLLYRAVLIVPADVYARVLGNPGRAPLPGSMWLAAPPADEGFLRLFVLAVWWVGPLLGALLVWRQGGRILDLFCGVVAGAVLGLAGAATLGCLLVLGDEIPRALLRTIAGSANLSPALATFLWLFLAVGCWAGIGAAAAAGLSLGGPLGNGLLGGAAAPVAAAARLVGLGKVAELFEPHRI